MSEADAATLRVRLRPRDDASGSALAALAFNPLLQLNVRGSYVC